MEFLHMRTLRRYNAATAARRLPLPQGARSKKVMDVYHDGVKVVSQFKTHPVDSIEKVDPVAGTDYTCLDTTSDVWGMFHAGSHNDTGNNRDLCLTAVIDGSTYQATFSALPNTWYYVYLSPLADELSEVATTPCPLGYSTPVYAHSLKTQIALATGALTAGRKIMARTRRGTLV